MSKITRRQFLLASATLPLLKFALPPVFNAPAVRHALSPNEQDGPARPNVLIMVFDTFSANHLWLAGYPRETTPNLARLAERATVYHHHYAGGNFTSPGTASMLMGLYPWTHRCIQSYSHAMGSTASNNVFNLLPDDYYRVAYTHNPLAASLLYQFEKGITELKPRQDLTASEGLISDKLFRSDYPVSIHAERTITGHNGRPAGSAFGHFLQSLSLRREEHENKETYGDRFPLGMPVAPLDAYFTIEDAVDWVGELSAGVANPYFAYVHLFPPHGPYLTRRDFVDIFQDGWEPVEKAVNPYFSREPSTKRMGASRRAYDEYIAYVDAEFGRLFDMLDRSGALDNTYLILTSDHGEMFERGFVGHSHSLLYDPIVHIPLMVWKPGQRERVDVRQRTSAVDLLPTLLTVTGQPVPEFCEGVVLPTFDGAVDDDGRIIYAVEAKTNDSLAPLTTGTIAAYQGAHKLIYYTGFKKLPSEGEYYELFNLENDPDELTNLAPTQPALANDMAQQLKQKLDEVNRPFRRA